MAHPYFDMHEEEEEGVLRLILSGELDMLSAAPLEDRLDHLAESRRPVRLDLSELQFIDSAGLRVLVRAIANAREDGWPLEVDPRLTAQVSAVLRLTMLDDYLMGGNRGTPQEA